MLITQEDYQKLYNSYYEVGLRAEELLKENKKLKEAIELASIMIVNKTDYETREAYKLLQEAANVSVPSSEDSK